MKQALQNKALRRISTLTNAVSMGSYHIGCQIQLMEHGDVRRKAEEALDEIEEAKDEISEWIDALLEDKVTP